MKNQNAHDANRTEHGVNRTRFGLDSDGCINPKFYTVLITITIALCLTNFYF